MELAIAAATSVVTWVSSAAAVVVGTIAAPMVMALGEGLAILVAQTALKVTAMALGSLALNMVMAPRVGTAGSPTSFKADPSSPIRGVMGRFGTGGTQNHMRVWGKNNLFISYSVILSLGPIQGIAGFEAGKIPVNFTLPQGEAANVEPYKGKMWMTYKNGLPTDGALGPPVGISDGHVNLMSEWTVNHRTSGYAGAFWTMKNNSKRASYEGGVPKPMWTVLGMKLYDPRKDSTQTAIGGSGPHRIGDWRTWEFSENPHIHAFNWAMGHFKKLEDGTMDRRFLLAGVGAPASAIVTRQFVDAANVADANGWKIAGEWNTQDDKWQVFVSMLQAGSGAPVHSGARIGVSVNAPKTSVATITREDIIGGMNIKVMASRRDRFNTVYPRYLSEEQDWEYATAGAVSAETYLAEDRGEERPKELTYNYVPGAKQAGQLAAYDLANTRETLKVAFPAKPHLLGIHPGEAVTVNSAEHGLDNQKFIVMSRPIELAEGTVAFELRSETDAKHPWALGQTAQPAPSPSLTAPSPIPAPPEEVNWEVVLPPPAPGGSQQPGFVVVGEVPDGIGEVIVEVSRLIDGPWESIYKGPPTAEVIPITGLESGETYYVWLTYVSIKGMPSDRKLIAGPIVAGQLVSDDTEAVGGTPAADLLADLLTVEQISAANAAAVADLFDVYGDTASAAASAIAAGESAILAQTKAEEASGSAAASSGFAGIAGTKADEAGNSASAALASQVAAESARDGASGSAAASAASAASASTSSGQAGDFASAASGSATTAATKAGEASTFASQASTSAADAVAASISAGVSASTARGAVAETIPTAPGVAPQGFSFNQWANPNDPGSDWNLANLIAADPTHFSVVNNALRISSNQIHIHATKITARPSGHKVRCSLSFRRVVDGGDASNNRVTLYAFGWNANLDTIATVEITNAFNPTVAQGVQTLTYDLSDVDIGPGCVWIRTMARIWTTDGATELLTVETLDVQSEAAAASSAAAAVAQAASASASASAASISANLAATAANARQNLIPNSTALSGIQQWTQWSAYTVQAEPASPDGSRFIWYVPSAGAKDASARSELLDYSPDQPTSISAEVYSGGMISGETRVYIEFLDASSNVLDYLVAQTYSVTNAWVTVKTENKISPAGTAYIRAYMDTYAANWGPSGAVAAWRKIKVEMGPTATPWNDYATDRVISAQLSVTSAVAADSQTRLASARFEVIAAAGGNPAKLLIRADTSGSLAELVAQAISFSNVVGGTIVEAMKLVGGEVFFMRPIYIDVGTNRLLVGPGGTWVLWYGATTFNASTATRTNGRWAFGTDGKVYYGGTELGNSAQPRAWADFVTRVGTRTSAGQVTTSTVTIQSENTPSGISTTWTQMTGDADWIITTPNGNTTTFRVNVSTPGEQRTATFLGRTIDIASGKVIADSTVRAAAIYNV